MSTAFPTKRSRKDYWGKTSFLAVQTIKLLLMNFRCHEYGISKITSEGITGNVRCEVKVTQFHFLHMGTCGCQKQRVSADIPVYLQIDINIIHDPAANRNKDLCTMFLS